MKKSCDNCRSLISIGQYSYRCRLGFKTKDIPKKIPAIGTIYVTVPDEECPKPLTYKKLFACEFNIHHK